MVRATKLPSQGALNASVVSRRDNFVREFTLTVSIRRGWSERRHAKYFRQGRRLLSTHFVLSNGLIIVSTCSETVVGVSPIESFSPVSHDSSCGIFVVAATLLISFHSEPMKSTLAAKMNDDRERRFCLTLFASICHRLWRARFSCTLSLSLSLFSPAS